MPENFRLIPVYDLQALFNSWKFYVPGLERVLGNSGDDTSLEKVYNDLMSGRLLLWVGFVNDDYAGFVTTQILDVPGAAKTLWIHHLYKRPKVESTWLFFGLEILNSFAKKYGCTRIKFYGLERPWQAKFEAAGFTRGYVEFVKEVSNEDLPKTGS